MDIMRPFIGVDGLEIGRMAHDLEPLGNTIAPMHVTAHAGDIQSFAAIVALHQANELWTGGAVVHHLTQSEGRLQAQGDFSLHIRELFLEKLGLCQRFVELFPVQTILQCGVPAKLSRAITPQAMP